MSHADSYGSVSIRPISVRALVENFAYLLIALVCLAVPWGHGEVFRWGLTPLSAPIFVLLAMLPFAAILYGSRLNVRPFDFTLIPLALLILGSKQWSQYPLVWSWTTYWYCACIVLYFAVRILAARPSTMYAIIVAAAAGAVASIPFLRPVWGGDFALPTVNQNFTAYAYTGAIYLLLLLQLTRAERVWKLLGLVAALLLFGALTTLGARGAILSAVLMAAWLVVWRLAGAGWVRPLFWISLTATLAFSFGLLEWIPQTVEGLFGNSTGDLSGRLPAWAEARHLISQNPATGIGAGAFRYITPDEIGAHNVFLTLSLDAGVIGTMAFLAFFVAGLWPGLRLAARPSQSALVGLCAAFFLPIASTGHVEHIPLIWVALAMTFTILRLQPDR